MVSRRIAAAGPPREKQKSRAEHSRNTQPTPGALLRYSPVYRQAQPPSWPRRRLGPAAIRCLRLLFELLPLGDRQRLARGVLRGQRKLIAFDDPMPLATRRQRP